MVPCAVCSILVGAWRAWQHYRAHKIFQLEILLVGPPFEDEQTSTGIAEHNNGSILF